MKFVWGVYNTLTVKYEENQVICSSVVYEVWDDVRVRDRWYSFEKNIVFIILSLYKYIRWNRIDLSKDRRDIAVIKYWRFTNILLYCD